jgi:hypothetical protein
MKSPLGRYNRVALALVAELVDAQG